MRIVTPSIFVLLYWLIFFIGGSLPSQARYGFLYLLVLFAMVVLFHGRAHVRTHIFLWLNFVLYGFGSYLFMLTLSSSEARNPFIIISGIIAASFISLIIFQQSAVIQRALLAPYRQPLSFIYMVSFWQLAVVLYFTRIFYSIPLSTLLLVVGLTTLIVSKGILEIKRLRKSSEFLVLLVIVIATVEAAYFLHLIPLHHVLLGTLLSLWFIVIVGVVDAGQELSSRRGIFRRYLTIYVIALFILLLTARWG